MLRIRALRYFFQRLGIFKTDPILIIAFFLMYSHKNSKMNRSSKVHFGNKALAIKSICIARPKLVLNRHVYVYLSRFYVFKTSEIQQF